MQCRCGRHHRRGVIAVAVVQQRTQRQRPRRRRLKIDVDSLILIRNRDDFGIVLDNLRLAGGIIAGTRFFRASGKHRGSARGSPTEYKAATRYSVLDVIGDTH